MDYINDAARSTMLLATSLVKAVKSFSATFVGWVHFFYKATSSLETFPADQNRIRLNSTRAVLGIYFFCNIMFLTIKPQLSLKYRIATSFDPSSGYSSKGGKDHIILVHLYIYFSAPATFIIFVRRER